MTKKIETSKIFLFIVTILSIFITAFSTWFCFKYETCEPLSYTVPAIFAELGAATAGYYVKAKNENKIKMCNLILNEFDIYLLGWVDRKTLNLNKEIVKISNDKTNSKEREYGNFFIKNAFNNSELIKILENNNVKKLKF